MTAWPVTPAPGVGAPTGADVVPLPARNTQLTTRSDVHSEALWARRRDTIARDRIAAHEWMLQRLKDEQRLLERSLADLDAEERALPGLRGQEVVLVRSTPGPALTVYHRASARCGRVFRLHNYDERFESEAQELGLTRCTACNWRI